jgi:hypothetical protein
MMRQSLRWPWVLPSCLVALSWLAPAAPAHGAPSRSQDLAPDSTPAVSLRDGVIVDAARGVAYVMDREGGVDALRTADGAVLWRSAEAAKPLLVAGDLLIAQAEPAAAGELPVVTLDRGTGRLLTRAAVALPAGLWAQVDDGPRGSFRAAAVVRAGEVVVRWDANRRKAGPQLQGYVPSPDEGRAPGVAPAVLEERSREEHLHGSAVLDPRSGAVRPEVSARAAAPAGGTVLRTFDDLAGVAGRKFLSADGRHVLVSRRAESSDPLEPYRWSLYTRGGRLLGELPSHRSAAPFVVVGAQVLYEARPSGVRAGETMVTRPLRLQAVELANGLEAWNQPIRQVEFAGPFPP